MKVYGRVDAYIHVFLTTALLRGEWSPSCPCHFTPGERAPGTIWIGGWIGLDDMEKLKFVTLPDSNSGPSVVQSLDSRYTDYATEPHQNGFGTE
jgi:hypothetical protein